MALIVTAAVAAGVVVFIAALTYLPKVTGTAVLPFVLVMGLITGVPITLLLWRAAGTRQASPIALTASTKREALRRRTLNAVGGTLLMAFAGTIALINLPAPWSIVVAAIAAASAIETWSMLFWLSRRARHG